MNYLTIILQTFHYRSSVLLETSPNFKACLWTKCPMESFSWTSLCSYSSFSCCNVAKVCCDMWTGFFPAVWRWSNNWSTSSKYGGCCRVRLKEKHNILLDYMYRVMCSSLVKLLERRSDDGNMSLNVARKFSLVSSNIFHQELDTFTISEGTTSSLWHNMREALLKKKKILTYLFPPLKRIPKAIYFWMEDCSNPLLALRSSVRFAPPCSFSTSRSL